MPITAVGSSRHQQTVLKEKGIGFKGQMYRRTSEFKLISTGDPKSEPGCSTSMTSKANSQSKYVSHLLPKFSNGHEVVTRVT